MLKKNAGKSAFSDHISLKTDIISLEYSQGYWVSGRGNGWDLNVPFKPKPNTPPDFSQTIRKGNLAPGEDRVWSLYLARQPAISKWTYQMRYCVTKKVCGGVKCKSIPEPIEYKNHKKLQQFCQERIVSMCVFQNAVCINSQERRETGF